MTTFLSEVSRNKTFCSETFYSRKQHWQNVVSKTSFWWKTSKINSTLTSLIAKSLEANTLRIEETSLACHKRVFAVSCLCHNSQELTFTDFFCHDSSYQYLFVTLLATVTQLTLKMGWHCHKLCYFNYILEATSSLV